ncbi:hypothetical protein EON63_17015 [archaeon]|nr:MAG: hypothetical protein EON63_17015 [archaeon]
MSMLPLHIPISDSIPISALCFLHTLLDAFSYDHVFVCLCVCTQYVRVSMCTTHTALTLHSVNMSLDSILYVTLKLYAGLYV